MISLLAAIADDKLFKPWFREPNSWQAWMAFIAALFGLPMTEEQRATYIACTGRTDIPTTASNEAWLIIGRRGGKSFVMALIAVYLATFRSYTAFLQPGERATVLVIAADRRQARVIIRYVRAMLNRIGMLRKMIERETADTFDLNNSVTIEVGSASFRSTRGYTYAAVLADEIAFWRTDDAAEPDYAILDAIRPGMATIPGAMLICASSPYARRGALWDAYKSYFARVGTPLVWKSPTRMMNPSVPQEIIDRAMARDPASAGAEYMAEFRRDIEGFVTQEVVEACVTPKVAERQYLSEFGYFAFCDPSGGSSDSMTLAIGHIEGGQGVLDVLRERTAPFSPESVVAEFATVMQAYGLRKTTGDRYAGEWPREAFSKHGITYEPSARPKSDLYRDLLPLLNSGQVELLDIPHLTNQLVNLERRTSRGGRDSIDHPPNGHDDVANAAAGVLVNMVGHKKPIANLKVTFAY